MKLSIVIPAHNEEDSVERTIRVLHGHLNAERIDHEILIVNDNSSDRTEEILRLLQKEIPTVSVISNSQPNGFGFAVREGLEHYTGDAVAVYMADGSDRPEDLVQFFEALENKQVDCVFGSRFIRGAKVVGYPFLKLTLNRLANLFIRMTFGLRYNDVTNAFKLYRRHVIEGLKPFLSHHFNLTVELPLKAIVRGYTYTVVPSDWINRRAGTSKLKIQEMGSRYLFIILYCLIEKWFSKGDYLKRRLEQPRLEAGRTDAQEFTPLGVSWAIWVIFALCLIWAVSIATLSWHNSISDIHGFRQSQTAITSYYLARGGPFLRYETPIFGYPWSIPFEFPLYQWIVAYTSTLLHLQLNPSGRLISEIFFGLSLITMWAILSELRVRPVYRLIFVALTLVSPEYVFWSRTFMIESTALFFCLAYLYFIIRYVRTRKRVDVCIGGLCGVLGALVKLTTFPAFALVGCLVYFFGLRHEYKRFKEGAGLRKILLSQIIPALFFACFPVLITWLWVRYTDQVRALNIVAGPLSSAALWTWNFGTFNQRFLGSTWMTLLDQTIPDVLGSPIGLLLSSILALFLARHRLAPFLISIVGFLSAFLIFTNLHLVHNYYAYSNGIFLIAAVSWVIVGLLERTRVRKFLGIVLFLICIFYSVYGYYGRLYNIQNNKVNPFNNVAFEIKSVTPPEDVVLIFSKDWSSEVPYYSERRALTWPRWMPRNIEDPAMQEAINRLRNYRIGAVAFCDGNQANSELISKAINSFKITSTPDYEDLLCAVYPLSSPTTPTKTRKTFGARTSNYRYDFGWADCDAVGGWIWDRNQPNTSVNVEIYEGETRLATVPANQFRQDLLDGGIGNGNHSFVYTVPDRLKDGRPHSIEVRASETGFKLSDSPKSITCTTK